MFIKLNDEILNLQQFYKIAKSEGNEDFPYQIILLGYMENQYINFKDKIKRDQFFLDISKTLCEIDISYV